MANKKNEFKVVEVHPENAPVLECLQPLIQEWIQEVINHANKLELENRKVVNNRNEEEATL